MGRPGQSRQPLKLLAAFARPKRKPGGSRVREIPILTAASYLCSTFMSQIVVAVQSTKQVRTRAEPQAAS